jgi:transcriptional regulator with XRE-family HTH domain
VNAAEDLALVAALGLRMRVVRVARGWTQEQLADAAGLDRTYVTRLERGLHAPTVVTVWRVARALEVSFAELLDGTTTQVAASQVPSRLSREERRGACRLTRRPA